MTTVILDSSQVALQIHESCGHPIELDRVLGTEAAFAGMSFLTPEKLGNFMYGNYTRQLDGDFTPGLAAERVQDLADRRRHAGEDRCIDERERAGLGLAQLLHQVEELGR